ncbi:MAG: 50S ribosomal protein L21 [Anaerolineales bacterium]|nr:50S ribosomal protein L21 [Anaerolineales bacterium]
MGYAVFRSGGKQYIAREGSKVDVDRMSVEAGSEISFDEVLLTSDNGDVHVGTPIVEGAKVKAKVVGEIKGPKILVFKFKPKNRYKRTQGHRQPYTRVEIESIEFPSGKRAKKPAKKAEPEPEPEAEPEETAAAAPSGLEDVDLNSMLKADLEELAEELGVMPEEGSGAGGNVLVKDLKEAIRGVLGDND